MFVYFIRVPAYFKERKESSFSNNDSILKLIKQKNIILSSVHTPHNSSLIEFKRSFKPIFDNICRNNKDLYLAGDILD